MPNTLTPNVGLSKPAQGDANWNVPLNGNFDIIDSLFGAGTAIPSAAFTTLVRLGSLGVYGFSSNVNPTAAVSDTGWSRISANVSAFGNGTQGDTTGNLQLNSITKYGGVSTGGQGVVPIMTPITSQKTETAADAALLTFTPPAIAGSYRIGFQLSVSAAAGAVLGWTATWKDSNGTAQAPTNLALNQIASGGGNGTAAPALTFTTSTASNYSGEFRIDIDASATAIVLKFTLTGGTITAKATATIERLI